MLVNQTIIISVDAMGGSKAPHSVIEGMASIAVKHPNVHFIVFGDSLQVMPLLHSSAKLTGRYEFIHCPDAISDDQQPVQALKKGINSSMRKAIDCVKEKKADAVVSGGNTGALMVMSKLVLKTIHGIDRPAIVSIFPNFTGGVVMLDLGANAECNAHNLFQFALMGHCYAQATFKKHNPSIGILNVGIEEYKGRDIDKKAYDLLKNSELNFYGHIEGHDITEGTVDVVVTDGFSGNIVLKVSEGVASLCKDALKATFNHNMLSKLAGFIVRKKLKSISATLDPRNHNGAMFIGIDGIVVKSHGSSDAYAFANALEVAINLVQKNINQQISTNLARITETETPDSTIVGKIKKSLGF